VRNLFHVWRLRPTFHLKTLTGTETQAAQLAEVEGGVGGGGGGVVIARVNVFGWYY
jgi:hypothetical protein